MPADVEADLHAHCQALRSLARALVGDGHADDLVQDTALAALQQPMPKRSLAAWLANVVRFLAHKHHRGERRRALREQAVARPEAEPPADRDVETGDSLRRLTDDVLALPQPYREVVLLRYLHELSPTAIAQRTRTPLATVKSQLQRGLGMLRQRLQEGNGDWRAGLCLAFAIEPLPAAAAFTTSQVLLMGSGVKLAVGGGIAVLAAAMALLLIHPDTAVTPGANTSAQEAGGSLSSSTGVAASAVATDEPSVQRRESPPAVDTTAPLATLRGRCVDQAGMPLPGVEAKLGARGNGSMDEWVRKHGKPEPIALTAVTDGDGRFAFRFAPLPPFSFDLLLQGPGVADMTGKWLQIAADAAIDLGEIRMHPGVRVRGLVVDSEGAAVAKAQIDLQRDDPDQGTVQALFYFAARTGPDGRFEMSRALMHGPWRVGLGEHRTVLEGRQASLAPPTMDLRVVVSTLDPAWMISGTVVDERGAPLRGVRVGNRGGSPSTDAEGQFTMHRGKEDPETVLLRLELAGFEVLEARDVAWGARELRLTMTAVKGQAVHVVRATDGSTVEDFTLYVARVARPGEATSSADGGVRSRGRHELGRANLRLSSGSYLVFVEPGDESLAIGGPVPLEVTAAGTASAVVRLTPRTARTVRLLRQDGSPVSGARAQLCLPPTSPLAKDVSLLSLVDWCSNATWPMQGLRFGEGTTDGSGEVRIHGPQDGTFTLLLPGPGHAPQRLDGVRWGEPEPLVVTVATGATLRGRCFPPEALADLRNMAGHRKELQPSLTLSREGRAISFPPRGDPPISVADDGSFAVEHAPPGTWQLHIRVTLRSKRDDSIATGVEVDQVVLRDGETTQALVDLSGFLTGEIDAQVLHNGVPMAEALVCPVPITTPGVRDVRTWLSWVATDAEGRFHSTRARGPYRLEWTRDQRYRGLRADEAVTVVPSQTVTQTFHFRTGTLRVRLLDASGMPAANVSIQLRDSTGEERQRLSTDGDGRAEILFEAGEFTCKTQPVHLIDPKAQEKVYRDNPGNTDALAPSLLTLGNVTVLEGKTTENELRLPADYRR